MLDEFASSYDAFSVEEVEEAKEMQIKNKKQIEAEARKENRTRDVHALRDVVNKYNLTHVDQFLSTRLSESDYMLKLTIQGSMTFIEDIIGRRNQHRLDFERKMRDPDSFEWWHVCLINFFKTILASTERAHIESLNPNYMLAGSELLKYIFDKNNIDVGDFCEKVAQVMECKEDKTNSIFLVGDTNAGKTTLAKLLTQGLLKCLIGQSGNNSTFLFQEVPDKTVVHQEEAIFIPQNLDDYKNICGGETNYSVQVKNKKSRQVEVRTPYISTSNRAPWDEWCSTSAFVFENRGHIFTFNQTLIKNTVRDLIKKYEVVQSAPGSLYMNVAHLIHLRDNPNLEYEKARDWIYNLKALSELSFNSDRWCDVSPTVIKRIMAGRAPSLDELDCDEEMPLTLGSPPTINTVEQEIQEVFGWMTQDETPESSQRDLNTPQPAESDALNELDASYLQDFDFETQPSQRYNRLDYGGDQEAESSQDGGRGGDDYIFGLEDNEGLMNFFDINGDRINPYDADFDGRMMSNYHDPYSGNHDSYAPYNTPTRDYASNFVQPSTDLNETFRITDLPDNENALPHDTCYLCYTARHKTSTCCRCTECIDNGYRHHHMCMNCVLWEAGRLNTGTHTCRPLSYNCNKHDCKYPVTRTRADAVAIERHLRGDS